MQDSTMFEQCVETSVAEVEVTRGVLEVAVHEYHDNDGKEFPLNFTKINIEPLEKTAVVVHSDSSLSEKMVDSGVLNVNFPTSCEKCT